MEGHYGVKWGRRYLVWMREEGESIHVHTTFNGRTPKENHVGWLAIHEEMKVAAFSRIGEAAAIDHLSTKIGDMFEQN